eukprot:gb/GEZN01002638.1/.p1 GENE.gb/GEZN01002638.1/~~gb/GEZN01002638.1/.p1  ORF type:complete len:352 (+),score=42.20 gb/GEZN01002638.1/:213-1268(+)
MRVGRSLREVLGVAGSHSEVPRVSIPTPHQRFLFDLNGFLHVPSVLSAEKVRQMNEAIDRSVDRMKERAQPALRNTKKGSAMDAPKNRKDLGGLLQGNDGHLFRALLAHPSLVPYLTAMCGEGYRLDHQPMAISQESDSEGFHLHGGPMLACPASDHHLMNPELQYRCVNGTMWNSLIAMSVQLCDTGPGDGGLCLLRGSHKLNFAVPDAMTHGLAGSGFQEHVYQPSSRAGDVLFFTEATVHGALPWKALHPRRLVIFRFAPANMAYGRGYTEGWGGLVEAPVKGGEEADSKGQEVSEAELAVLEPPYAPRLHRPLVRCGPEQNQVSVHVIQRNPCKVQHDKDTFGTRFF